MGMIWILDAKVMNKTILEKNNASASVWDAQLQRKDILHGVLDAK